MRIEKKRLPSFRFHYSTPRGAPFAGGTQRDSDAIPLRVPACRLHAVEQLTLAVAPVNYWRKGLLRFWLTAGFIPRVFCSWLTDFQLKFLHYHQSCEVETASVVRYLLPHWIDSKFADGSKTKLDVRFISTHKLPPIRG